MNVLILTANTGGGHNGAARAIAEELEARGIPHQVENALSFIPRYDEKLIVDGHAFAYEYFPGLYDASYKSAEKSSSKSQYRTFARYAPRLGKYIQEGGYDTVICVHVFASHMMTYLRKKGVLAVKQYFVATDYTCTPGFEMADMDRVFIPQGLTREFLLAGAKEDMLLETGIPVRSVCYEPVTREFAREELYSVVPVRPEDKLVLVAPGCLEHFESKGLLGVCDEVPEALVVVLCGKGNSNLKRQISRLGHPQVKGLSYTTKMDVWMKAADLLVTKPGGLTSTEAVSCGVPTILLNVIGGPETHNRNHFVNRGCASSAMGFPALYNELVRLLQDDHAREVMRENQRANFSTVAVAALVDEVVRQNGLRELEARGGEALPEEKAPDFAK